LTIPFAAFSFSAHLLLLRMFLMWQQSGALFVTLKHSRVAVCVCWSVDLWYCLLLGGGGGKGGGLGWSLVEFWFCHPADDSSSSSYRMLQCEDCGIVVCNVEHFWDAVYECFWT
jgi:hypothetical protein